MAAIPIPGVNTPTYQSWGAAVATRLNTIGFAKVQSSVFNTAGYARITAANLGLPGNLDGLTCTITNAQAYVAGMVIESATNLLVICVQSNGTLVPNGTTLVFACVGWTGAGTGALIAGDDEINLLDERHEINHLDED